MLSMVLIMYMLVASFSSRVLLAVLHLEGAMLSGLIMIVLWSPGCNHPWWLLLLLVMSAISGSIGLSLVVAANRKSGADQVRA